MSKMYECFEETCTRMPAYEVEWYGMNQHGEETFVSDFQYSCDIFNHIVRVARHDDFGGLPDGIIDMKSSEEDKNLLERVCDALDPSRAQLDLFSEKRI